MRKSKKSPPPILESSFTKLKRYIISSAIALVLGGIYWTQDTVHDVHLPEAGKVAELYANQTRDDLTHVFTSAIGSAKQSVLLIVYALTDPDIIASLQNKSQEGVPVRVICDAKASPYIDSKLGAKVATTRRFGPGLMHQKILVIDGQQTWIGSANMTTESLRMHGNLVSALDSPALSKLITNKANTMQIEGKCPAFPHEEFVVGNQRLEMWFLPDDHKKASLRLIDLIRSAKKTIRVAMFTWTRQDLAQEIVDASKRGVKVETVIDHYSGKGASAKIVAFLKKKGVPVALSPGGPLLHHKFLYIDGKTLVNGSANWTNAAFTQNDDCFIVMHDLTPEQKKRMETLWKTIRSESEEP